MSLPQLLLARSRPLARLGLACGLGFAVAGTVPAAEPLPLRRVVMVNSGIGFFEHGGPVEGNRKVEFTVGAGELNDLLKSLVVQDLGGGKIAAVNYASPEPVSETLRQLSVDLTANPSLSQIFHQLRGHQIEFSSTGLDGTTKGTIVGVERRRTMAANAQVVDTDILTVRTATGIRSVPVASILATAFPEEKIDRDFQQALDLLAGAHQESRKTVELDLRGDGPRQIRVGYMQEVPVWKTSYRLVLDDNDPPRLQGWAIVENTTSQDWSEIQLTLLGGQPISFQMDLYSPLFATRPTVAPETPTAVQPRTYQQNLYQQVDEFLAGASKPARLPSYGGLGGFGGGLGGMGGSMGGGFFGGGGDNTPGFAAHTSSMESVAQTAEIGHSFRYAIATPVSLKRHESAMLPIVNDEITGEQVAIFDSRVHPSHPLAGVQLTNSTKLHLQAGPITVFDDGEYAGDARLGDVPSGTKRLISYALDLKTEVVTATATEPPELIGVSIDTGRVLLKRRDARRTTYTVKNSSDQPRKLLLEQPLDANWPTVEPAPAEKTRESYRFAFTVPAGRTDTFAATEWKPADERLPLREMSQAQFETYGNSALASVEVQAALKNLQREQAALRKLAAEREPLEQRNRELIAEQQRLRESLRAVGPAEALHQRYVKKLGQTEDELEALGAKLKHARETELAAEQAFHAKTETLTVK
ncbi:hypothetical protein [Planctellipticum variicoloris]|uniref:hypothetical protein n=1 Tax=Planctellipticum variicoloris TaxID=3064265 RepID=UPI0030134388|nr:hypothetical protein SH412_002481 [Planctomycetaceae bacterium SH412]